MLEDSIIEDLADPQVYVRGKRYFSAGHVVELENIKENEYRAVVSGTQDYRVRLSLSMGGEDIFSYECNCPAARQSFRACKHVVAAALAVQESQGMTARHNRGNSTSEDPWRSQREAARRKQQYEKGLRMLELFRSHPPLSKAKTQMLRLEPQLFALRSYYDELTLWLEFRIGEEKMYVLKDLASFLRSVDRQEEVRFGKNLLVDTAAMQFEPEISGPVWQMLRDAWHQLNSGRRASYFMMSPFQQKRFMLSSRNLETFFACMGDCPFVFQTELFSAREVSLAKGNPALSVAVKRDPEGGGLLSMDTGGAYPLDSFYRYVCQGSRIYETEESTRDLSLRLFQSFGKDVEIAVSPGGMKEWFDVVLPKLEQVAEIDVAESFEAQYLMEPLQAEFYLDYHGDGVEARPLFRYGSAEYNPLIGKAPEKADGRILVTDTEKESRLLGLFLAYDFEEQNDCFVQPDEEKAYEFLSEGLPALSEQADVFYTEAFQKKPVQQMARVTAGVSVNDSNLLEISLHAEDIDFDEILDILASYRKKRRYHRLKDGTFVTLEEQQLAAVAELVENTGIRKGSIRDGEKAEMPLSQAMYLDALAREEEGLRLERSSRFRSVVKNLRNPAEAEVDVPARLAHVLRDYQVTGFNWLSTLASYGLGGILADDMGLGKTLQVLAFLLSQKDENKAPALVVAPTSLMYNWAEEAERFTPELRAVVIAGTKEERTAALEQLDRRTDFAITTYNMLARDLELYEKKQFSYCFLDEAQHIKNPSTQKAKAVKHIRAGVCFALTGTPIENTLTELWSIFDFLMPGYLLNHAKFKQRYETPIVRGQDAHAAKDLKRHVTPFILRRLKKDVLRELPDKVERRLINEMTEEQAKVYRAYFVQAKKEFAQELQKHGFGESRIKILAILTRLRQIACDPSLFLESYGGGSGKLDMLEEIVTDAVASGHRILLFSQFTSMLQNIGKRLRDLQVGYFYLDGQTPSLERIRLVKKFNEGTMPIFLISLKAGGTGLNLTGADMVIHYDPWWNPAVEDQATDRAYRIGQQKNVQVLKLITKHTIEEQIYELQQKKKSLIDKMIEPGENFLSKLSEEEIRGLFEGGK